MMYSLSKTPLTLVGLGPRGAGKTALAGALARLQGFLYGGEGPIPDPRDARLFPMVARYQTRTRHVSHVDLPGHLDPVDYLLPARIRVDGAVLVLDPGSLSPAPWLDRAGRLGAPVAAVFVNRSDVAWPGLRGRVEDGLRAALASYGLGDVPVVFGSALDALRALRLGDLTDDSIEGLHAVARTLEGLDPVRAGSTAIWA